VSDLKLLTPAFEPGITTYRAFHLDDQGRITLSVIIDARSDEEAIGKAGFLENAYGIDLWERARHLGTFPPRIAA
jgi:hypothetical protein